MIKTDVPNLVRVSTGVFENTDNTSRNVYLNKRSVEMAKQSDVDDLRNKVDRLNDDISDIKTMLKQLINI